jgi:hypothetical protein
MFQPFVGLGDGLAFGIAEGVSILLGRHHAFEQMNHGGKLAGAKLVEQLMGVIDISGHCFLPTEFFYVGLTSSLRMLSETIARGQASSGHHRRRPGREQRPRVVMGMSDPRYDRNGLLSVPGFPRPG